MIASLYNRTDICLLYTHTTNHKPSCLLLLLNSKRTRRIVNSGHLRRRRQRTTQTQIPHTVVLHSGQILGDGDGHLAILLREAICELDLVVEVDRVQVANGVVVQPNAVIVTRVLGQRVLAVGGWGTVEADVDDGAGGDGGIVRDALVDVDAGVVALAPGFDAQLIMQETYVVKSERTYAGTCQKPWRRRRGQRWQWQQRSSLWNWFFAIGMRRSLCPEQTWYLYPPRSPQAINNIHPDPQGPASDWPDLRHALPSAEWATYPIGKDDIDIWNR